MIHGVQELVLICEVANNKVEPAKRKDKTTAWENGVYECDDEYEDGLWKEEPIGEHRGFPELFIVTRGTCAYEVDWVQSDRSEFEKAEGEHADTLENDKVNVEGSEAVERASEGVGDPSCVGERTFEFIPKFFEG